MKRFLKRIFHWRRRKSLPLMPQRIIEPEEWTNGDAESLRVFMQSTIGKKLRETLWFEATRRALVKRDRPAFERGNVAGMIETIEWLERLAEPIDSLAAEED